MKKNIFGFTLVEIMVVVAFMGIIASLTIPYMTSFYSRQQLNTLMDEVNGNLRRAQNNAIINKDNVSWGITWHSTDYTIVKDPGGADEAVAETFEIPNNYTITGSDIIFEKLTGQTSTDTTITISAASIDEQKQININQQGAVQSL